MKTTAPILLIEHDPDDQFLLERALRKADILNRIEKFISVEAALEYLKGSGSQHPAFIIVNVGVFCRNGARIISWMAEQPLFKQVPIIAIGDGARPDDAQRAFDVGANAYFGKGVDMNELAKMIRDLEFVSDFADNYRSQF